MTGGRHGAAYALFGLALFAWWLGLPLPGVSSSHQSATLSVLRAPPGRPSTGVGLEVRTKEEVRRYGGLGALRHGDASHTATAIDLKTRTRRPATPAEVARLTRAGSDGEVMVFPDGFPRPRPGWSVEARSLLLGEALLAAASWLATCVWWRALRRWPRPARWTHAGPAAILLVAWPALVGYWSGVGLWQAAGRPLPEVALVAPKTMIGATALLLAVGTVVLCAAPRRPEREEPAAAPTPPLPAGAFAGGGP